MASAINPKGDKKLKNNENIQLHHRNIEINIKRVLPFKTKDEKNQ